MDMLHDTKVLFLQLASNEENQDPMNDPYALTNSTSRYFRLSSVLGTSLQHKRKWNPTGDSQVCSWRYKVESDSPLLWKRVIIRAETWYIVLSIYHLPIKSLHSTSSLSTALPVLVGAQTPLGPEPGAVRVVAQRGWPTQPSALQPHEPDVSDYLGYNANSKH